jgi:hypothetical protein
MAPFKIHTIEKSQSESLEAEELLVLGRLFAQEVLQGQTAWQSDALSLFTMTSKMASLAGSNHLCKSQKAMKESLTS